MVQTVSRTLMEEVTFDRSTVTSQDWSSYPIIAFPDVPEVVIDLIDRPSRRRSAPASRAPRSCRPRSRMPCSMQRASACARCR